MKLLIWWLRATREFVMDHKFLNCVLTESQDVFEQQRGGSSRQVVILKRGETYNTRLLTVREAARLMGAPETYKIPGSYNDGYTAMGDAVAMPVARYLGKHLLAPIEKKSLLLTSIFQSKKRNHL